jgi:hypothetical protein
MKSLLIALPLLGLTTAAFAQEPAFTVEPSLVHSDNGAATTFGLAYDFNQSLVRQNLGSEGEIIRPDQPVRSFSISLEGSGLITASAEDNPENFLETTIKAETIYQSGGGPGGRLWLFSGGFFGSLETDQSFNNQQVTFGAHATFATTGVFTRAKDDFGLHLTLGEVQPGEDLGRQAALGVTSLENYQRFSAELNYQIQTGHSFIPDIEFNYRWMNELDAPAAIVAADLDRFELFTVRLGLPANLYVAYSEGRLPFDLEDDRIFKAGFSYELGELGRLLQGPSR